MHVELGIRIDIGGEQRVNDFERGNGRMSHTAGGYRDFATSTTSSTAASRRGLCALSSIDDDVEGGASPPVPDVGIGAAIEQQFGDIVVFVIEGEHQRSHA